MTDEPEYIPEYIHELGKNSRAAQRALRAALNTKEKLHTERERVRAPVDLLLLCKGENNIIRVRSILIIFFRAETCECVRVPVKLPGQFSEYRPTLVFQIQLFLSFNTLKLKIKLKKEPAKLPSFLYFFFQSQFTAVYIEREMKWPRSRPLDFSDMIRREAAEYGKREPGEKENKFVYLYVYMGGHQFIGSRLSDPDVLLHQVRKLQSKYTSYGRRDEITRSDDYRVHWNVLFLLQPKLKVPI